MLYFSIEYTMPSISMVRYMLYTTSTRPMPATTSLMFSLPCLSPTESAYVQLQLDTVQASANRQGQLAVLSSQVEGLRVTKKTARITNNPLLMERCMAIATAYQVDDRDSGLTDLIRLCEEATDPHNKFNRRFTTFRPSPVQTGLEWVEMVGSSRVWLDLARERRFNYNLAQSDLSEKREFQMNYKRRLLEVMDRLGELGCGHYKKLRRLFCLSSI